MGNTISGQRIINFEDMQYAINEKLLIVNTLPIQQQPCLIAGTLSVEMEVEVLNTYLKKNKEVQIILYGMNATDETCLKKYDQLLKLGFYNVYIYGGGLFEWLLLQDVYGAELFPTTSTKVDMLKYKGRRQLRGVSTPLTPHYG